MIAIKKSLAIKIFTLSTLFALMSCAATSESKPTSEVAPLKNPTPAELPADKQISPPKVQQGDSAAQGLGAESLGEWNPQVENKDCRKDQQLIFKEDAFVDCVESLDEFEAQIFLRQAFWPDSLWLKTLETRKATWLHLKRNRRQAEAKFLMEQMLNLFSQVEPYKQEVLAWLEAESQAQKSRLELWQDKFHELENSLRLGNSRTQLEARIEGLDKSVLDVEGLQRLDSLLNKAQSIDSLRVTQKWEIWTQSENEGERELAKQVLLEKYTYLLNPTQSKSLMSGVKPEDDYEAQCEEMRVKAAEYVAESKTNPKRKRELLLKASSELTSCIELLPEGDYKDKVEIELRKVRRWM